MTVLSARSSARARPIAACMHHRPPGARPGHDHDPDTAARKADELDRRAQPAASRRTHPPAVDVDPALTNRPRRGCRSPIRSGPWAAPRQRDARSLLPRGPDQRWPETTWPTNPRPSLKWDFSAVQPSTRLADGVPSAHHDHVEGVEFQPAAHRGSPASASMSALLTLAGDEQEERGASTISLSLTRSRARVDPRRRHVIDGYDRCLQCWRHQAPEMRGSSGRARAAEAPPGPRRPSCIRPSERRSPRRRCRGLVARASSRSSAAWRANAASASGRAPAHRPAWRRGPRRRARGGAARPGACRRSRSRPRCAASAPGRVGR